MLRLSLISIAFLFMFSCTCRVDSEETTEEINVTEDGLAFLVTPDGDTVYAKTPGANLYAIPENGEFVVYESKGKPVELMEVIDEDTIWSVNIPDKVRVN